MRFGRGPPTPFRNSRRRGLPQAPLRSFQRLGLFYNGLPLGLQLGGETPSYVRLAVRAGNLFGGVACTLAGPLATAVAPLTSAGAVTIKAPARPATVATSDVAVSSEGAQIEATEC